MTRSPILAVADTASKALAVIWVTAYLWFVMNLYTGSVHSIMEL